MDEAVNRLRLIGFLLTACALPAAAQVLRDPTRPPAAMMQGAAGAGTTAAAVASGPQLQSILIAREPGGRHVAVIDGETVRLGEIYKGARLTRMSANEVELVRGRERRVLKLNPGATATPTPASGASLRASRD
jgi:MSHA biogenesis protein MshK